MTRLFFLSIILLMGCGAQPSTKTPVEQPACMSLPDKCDGAYISFKAKEGKRPFRVLQVTSSFWRSGREYTLHYKEVPDFLKKEGVDFHEKGRLPPHLLKVYREQLAD